MMTDPIGDMLTRIRNAAMARKEHALVPLSKIKLAIARILKEEGYINEVEVKGREMVIHLKYGVGKQPAIRGLKRVSKPGRRMYVGVDSIPSVMSGHGISILSTSKGILTDKQAKRLRAGGELICQVWGGELMGVTKGASISRIGRQPIPIPPGVKVQIGEKEIFVQGPIGSIRRSLPPLVFVAQEGHSLVVKPVEQAGKDGARYQGLTRALLKNAIEGVTTGFQKQLDLVGTGYRAEVKGKQLTLSVGYSHPILYTLPDGVDAKVEIIDIGGTKRPRLHLRSVDKELLGQTAYRIRSFRPPEPYKGKGIRFVDEKIREKAGKARKAGGKK